MLWKRSSGHVCTARELPAFLPFSKSAALNPIRSCPHPFLVFFASIFLSSSLLFFFRKRIEMQAWLGKSVQFSISFPNWFSRPEKTRYSTLTLRNTRKQVTQTVSVFQFSLFFFLASWAGICYTLRRSVIVCQPFATL